MGIFSVMDIYRIIYFAYRILNTFEGRRKQVILRGGEKL